MKIRIQSTDGRRQRLDLDAENIALKAPLGGSTLMLSCVFGDEGDSPIQMLIWNDQIVGVRAITVVNKKRTTVKGFSYRRGEKMVTVKTHSRALQLPRAKKR